MDRRSIAQLRTATDLVTSRLAVDLSLGRPAGGDGNGPCDARLTDDLKARRQTLGWSVDEVSGRCGIDRDALHGWERGIASPRLDALQRWATALGLSFRLVAVEPNSMFASEARLPGARLRFENVIEPAGSGSRITHRVELDGPLAFLYARPVRKGVERGLPDGVDRLAALAESDSRD